jgi:hypothetical protein
MLLKPAFLGRWKGRNQACILEFRILATMLAILGNTYLLNFTSPRNLQSHNKRIIRSLGSPLKVRKSDHAAWYAAFADRRSRPATSLPSTFIPLPINYRTVSHH